MFTIAKKTQSQDESDIYIALARLVVILVKVFSVFLMQPKLVESCLS